MLPCFVGLDWSNCKSLTPASVVQYQDVEMSGISDRLSRSPNVACYGDDYKLFGAETTLRFACTKELYRRRWSEMMTK